MRYRAGPRDSVPGLIAARLSMITTVLRFAAARRFFLHIADRLME